MNQTIVRLNEFKAVKMASLSKGKRPAAKFNKEVATYLLDNWDNLEQLKTCVQAMHKDMPEGCEEVMQMYDNRISELEPKQPRAKKEPKAKTEKKAAEPAKKSEKKATKAQTKSEGGEKSKRGRKATHYVGEVHPKNPNWIWMEYAPGKFDWKSIRGKQGAEQFPDRTPVETKSEKKESAGKAGKTTKQAAKKSEKKAAKDKEPQLTLEELLAKPIPQGLSKPQQNVIKALKKGYKIRKDGQTYWLTDKDGNNERTEKGVLEALQRRYKINYVPKGAMFAK
jgi:hypothetical protein